MTSLALELLGVLVGGFLFVGMLIALEVGRRVGVRQIERHGATNAKIGVGVADSAVYALFALLIGFSFSGAAARFDSRRAIVSRAVGAISTAWSRIDYLPAEAQAPLRDDIRRYLDAVIQSYATPGSPGQALAEPAAVAQARHDIWSHAVVVTTEASGEKARMLLVPSLNEMFDVVDEERLARRLHPPILIFVLLGVAGIAAGLFAGYSLAPRPTRNWFFILGVATTVAIAGFVIIELEFPRLGLVRVNSMDEALVELRTTLK